MGASGSQAAAGQQSAKCQGAGRPGSALRAPAPAAYLSEAAAPCPEVPCAPSQMKVSVCSLRKVFRTGLIIEMSLEQASEDREEVSRDGHLEKLV